MVSSIPFPGSYRFDVVLKDEQGQILSADGRSLGAGTQNYLNTTVEKEGDRAIVKQDEYLRVSFSSIGFEVYSDALLHLWLLGFFVGEDVSHDIFTQLKRNIVFLICTFNSHVYGESELSLTPFKPVQYIQLV